MNLFAEYTHNDIWVPATTSSDKCFRPSTHLQLRCRLPILSGIPEKLAMQEDIMLSFHSLGSWQCSVHQQISAALLVSTYHCARPLLQQTVHHADQTEQCYMCSAVGR